MTTPSDETKEIVTLAGWFPGRRVGELVDEWEAELAAKGGFELHDAARRFLLEFGGLAWPTRDGEEHLERFSFNLDPSTAAFEGERFDTASTIVGERLFPVGEVASGHYFLASGESGCLYLVMDDVHAYGRDPWAALHQLLRSR